MTRFTPSTTKAEAEDIVRQWIDRRLWRHEAHLAETGGIAHLEPAEIETLGRTEAGELDALLRLADGMFAGEQKARITRALGPSAGAIDDFTNVVTAAGRTMGVETVPDTADGRLWTRLFLRGYPHRRMGAGLYFRGTEFRCVAVQAAAQAGLGALGHL